MSIVIIGAGPAGCSTSMFLSKMEIPHIILDKAVFPRDKICGDGLTHKVIYALKKWNPEIDKIMTADPKRFLPSRGGVLVTTDRNRYEVAIEDPENPITEMFTSKRIDFDTFLTEQLDSRYADIRFGVDVTAITKVSQGIEVQYKQNGETQSMKASVVIGADGDRSIVQKTLVPFEKDPMHYGGAIRAYYKGVTGFNKDNYMEFHLLKEIQPGYLWIFPLPNGYANVGLGTLKKYASEGKRNFREELLSLVKNHPDLKERFKDATLEGKISGWSLPMGSKLPPLSGDHFLLTGDAACLIDPISGEGIGNALYSGWLAAEAIQKAIAANDFTAAIWKKHYDERLYRTMGGDLKISHFFQVFYKMPRLVNFFAKRAYKNHLLLDTLLRMNRDDAVQKRFYSPFFYVKVIWGFFF